MTTKRQRAMLRLALCFARKATDAAVLATERADGRDTSASDALVMAARAWSSAQALRASVEGGYGFTVQEMYLRHGQEAMRKARSLAGLT
jgi:hypothetical protein